MAARRDGYGRTVEETSNEQRERIESDERTRAGQVAHEPQDADGPLSEQEQARGEGRQADG